MVVQAQWRWRSCAQLCGELQGDQEWEESIPVHGLGE
jgi:hypothetical protein